MCSSPSRLESLIPEILELIAFYAGTNVQGASSPDLLSLFCTSRSIYRLLAHNSHLYGKIFTAKFDIAAVRRRLGDGWTGPDNLMAELQRRCMILRRVRMLEVENPVNVLINLWTMYLMLIESDGKNDLHLLTNRLALRYVAAVMSWKDRIVPRHHGLHWLEDRQVAGLCLWIIWLSHTRESISLEDMAERHVLNYYVQPFIIAGWKHTSFYAPDTHQYISPSWLEMGFAPSVAGSTPEACQFLYFGQALDLVAPCVTPAAMLIAHARYEIGLSVRAAARAAQAAQLALIQQAATPQPPQPQPGAQALHNVTATTPPPANVVPVPTAAGVNDQDIAEYEDNVRVVMPARRDWSKPHQDLSIANDADWARLTGCFDLGDFDGFKPIHGRDTYTPGTLSGSFFGSLVTPDMRGFSQVLTNPDYPAHEVQWAGRPLFWRLREHHAIGDGPLIPSGLDSQRWGDDVLNAWLPRDVSMTSTPDELVVNTLNEFGERERCTYATYRGGAQPYAQRYMDQLQAEHSEDEDMDDDLEGAYIGNPRHKIRDIIVTGETDGRHGDAWGHYRFVGRIRPWDGLIVLLRTPTRSDDLNHGRWVFRGYMHAGNLVGRWREAHLDDQADRLGYEGAFVMVRSQHDW